MLAGSAGLAASPGLAAGRVRHADLSAGGLGVPPALSALHPHSIRASVAGIEACY